MKIRREVQISTASLLSIWTLNYQQILSVFMAEDFQFNFKSALYDSHHINTAGESDLLFTNAWLHLEFPDDGNGAWYLALKHLKNTFLEISDGSWHIKTDELGAWQQSLVSRMSAIPLLAFAQAIERNEASYGQSTQEKDSSKSSWRLGPQSALVRDYLELQGLNETHLHLNGSTHTEDAWLYALQRPTQSSKEFSIAWKKNRSISELTRAVDPDLTPSSLLKRLRTAKEQRQILMHAACSDENWNDKTHYKDYLLQKDSNTFGVIQELQWQTSFLQRWNKNKNNVLGKIFHRYVLNLNLYHQLMVQNEISPGLGHFEKNTKIGLREDIEKSYEQRFKDAHGPDQKTSLVRYFEGRFAPKTSVRALLALLLNILRGYQKYLCDLLPPDKKTNFSKKHQQLNSLLRCLSELVSHLRQLGIQPLQLTLVCHFIRSEWSESDKKFAPYRHHTMVKRVTKHTEVLLGVIKQYPNLRQWIRGVDGAANELHAPPDFFAPFFRACARHGIKHKTFHAGEDFPHLLSGLRYMLDAIELLDLGAGDRLGHGTAMGIDPSLWLSRVPQTILIKRGDWFLSLLAAWRLYQLSPTGLEAAAHVIKAALSEVTNELFCEIYSAQFCENAMALRGLDLAKLLNWQRIEKPMKSFMFANDDMRIEMSKIQEAVCKNQSAFDMHWRWQNDRDLWSRSEKLISIKANFLKASDYVLLQQSLMHIVAAREIVIETMPSSNIRISPYKSFEEHHALRWMKAPFATHENDPNILVSLGSDDPGIFATDLSTEFHHLFFALKNKGLAENEALRRVAEVNERGRIYRFHATT